MDGTPWYQSEWVQFFSAIGGLVMAAYWLSQLAKWLCKESTARERFDQMYVEWKHLGYFYDRRGYQQRNVDYLIEAWEDAGKPAVRMPSALQVEEVSEKV